MEFRGERAEGILRNAADIAGVDQNMLTTTLGPQKMQVGDGRIDRGISSVSGEEAPSPPPLTNRANPQSATPNNTPQGPTPQGGTKNGGNGKGGKEKGKRGKKRGNPRKFDAARIS